MLPTASRAELLRSPRYVEYTSVKYATPFDPGATSQSSFKLLCTDEVLEDISVSLNRFYNEAQSLHAFALRLPCSLSYA